MTSIQTPKCILAKRLIVVDVAEYHFLDDDGISHWNYPADLEVHTIALQIDDQYEIALLADTPETRQVISDHDLELVEMDPIDLDGNFGDENQGTVEIIPGQRGYVVIEDVQKFSPAFREEYGL